MSELTINRIFERMMLAASGCVLVAMVAIFDENARKHVTGIFSGSAMVEAGFVGDRLQQAMHTVSQTVGYQGHMDSPLMMFAGAALVLFIFMFRL
jgi:hypothetical protein